MSYEKQKPKCSNLFMTSLYADYRSNLPILLPFFSACLFSPCYSENTKKQQQNKHSLLLQAKLN